MAPFSASIACRRFGKSPCDHRERCGDTYSPLVPSRPQRVVRGNIASTFSTSIVLEPAFRLEGLGRGKHRGVCMCVYDVVRTLSIIIAAHPKLAPPFVSLFRYRSTYA